MVSNSVAKVRFKFLKISPHPSFRTPSPWERGRVRGIPEFFIFATYLSLKLNLWR